MLNSNRCEPVSLPLIPRLRAEEIWTAMTELRAEEREKARSRIRCPSAARLIALASSGLSQREFFTIVDEEDYERVAQHQWRTVKRGSHVVAVAQIEGNFATALSRFITGVYCRARRVRPVNGDCLDNRKSNLDIYP